MYINKPSVTTIKAADRVNILHSTSCMFEQYLVKCLYPCPDMRHFMSHQKTLAFNIEIKHWITLLNQDRF